MSKSDRPERGLLRRLLRWIWRGCLAFLAILLLAMLAGFTWQSVGAFRDARRFPPRGDLIDIGGRHLHLDCRGSGEPTVVIEAGLQDWSTGWRRPQEAIAQATRVCTYDRAGAGWSESSDEPMDGLHLVADLHALLEEARIQRPVVLVGHSLGGMLNRIYYEEFPNEVAAMVLLEPGDPDQVSEMFPEAGENSAFGPWVETLASAIARLGVVRWFYRDFGEGKGYPEDEVAETRARMVLPQAARALASSARHLPVTAAQARRNKSLGAIPLAVVYSSRFDEVGTVFDDEEERQEFRHAMMRAWGELALSSSRGRAPLILEGADHISMVRDDRYWPLVVETVLDIVTEVRAEARSKGES